MLFVTLFYKEAKRTKLEAHRLYSPSRREEVFPETGLPVYPILGNSENMWGEKRAGAKSPDP
jgi:hypothetical protein